MSTPEQFSFTGNHEQEVAWLNIKEHAGRYYWLRPHDNMLLSAPIPEGEWTELTADAEHGIIHDSDA